MRFCSIAVISCMWFLLAGSAHAGMTVITLTDLAKARIDALSFFLVGYLFISWIVNLIWNQLAKSFEILPRLKYKHALGVVFVTGLLFYVVLTMISGARELLTPGAWEKQGSGYRLRNEEIGNMTKDERLARMSILKDAIWDYAEKNGGKPPAGVFSGGIDIEMWKYGSGGMYCLVSDVRPGGGRDVLVYEPSAAGGRRLVLLADGSIEDKSEGELKQILDRRVMNEK